MIPRLFKKCKQATTEIKMAMFQVCWISSVLTVVLPLAACAQQRHVLVFGGNGLLGSQCVEDLLISGYNVTIANRGTWYWDTAETIKDRVRHIKFDRYDQPPSELLNFVRNNALEAIIDFSAFVGQAIANVEDMLRKNPPRIYISISSDLVYEVVDKTDFSKPSQEEDAVRPVDPVIREQLSKRNAVGHGKLEVEEALANLGIPHVSLRLPDVIGPRDNTKRLWLTFLWIALPKGRYRPFQILDTDNRRLSLVDTKDVSSAVLKILMEPEPFFNQAINYAWEETLSALDLYQEIAKQLQLELHYELAREVVTIGYRRQSVIRVVFPSGTRGPMDVTKATKLGLIATSDWKDALSETIKFYRNAFREPKFEQERQEVLSILGEIVGEPDIQRLLDTLEHSNFIGHHDEL